MTGQFGGNNVDRLAEIEEHFIDCVECEEAHIPTDDARWLIDELKRLREANVILTNGIQRIGTHDAPLITATAGDYLARAVAAMKGEVSP